MYIEEYEKFNSNEKENFKRIINLLLGKTFFVNRIYDYKEERFKFNSDYRFVESNYDIFMSFFEIAGFSLQKDNNYEVIWLENAYDYNKKRLGKSTTLYLYALRLLYDEEREKVRTTQDVVVEVADLVKILIDTGAITKKPSNADLKEGLAELIKFNVIQKKSGNLDEPNSKIIILPSILFALTNDKLTKLSDSIKQIVEQNVERLDEVEDEEVNQNIAY